MKPTMGGNRDGVMALDAVHLNIFAWNKKLTKYVRDGKLEKAIQLFQWMQREGMNLNIYSLLFR
jgi:pentatricopeptide repeat protein